MRRAFTGRSTGMTAAKLRWGSANGAWTRVAQGAYLPGNSPSQLIDKAFALVEVTGGVASGTLAARLLGLDCEVLKPPFSTVDIVRSGRRTGVRRAALPADSVIEVDGIRCTDGLQTLLDLATVLDDRGWEAALESALRKRCCTVANIDAALSTRRIGNTRIRRVLAVRPPDAAPTESLLETKVVQLIRQDNTICTPTRQVEVHNRHGDFVARVDLAWPDVGVFLELDGQHHKSQPLYDARRETAVVAATGWLPGRFTWQEVVHFPNSTLRRIRELLNAATK
jgi:very-short-patch-repair endonuclease